MALITDLDDRTLVERHRAGDPDAFRRIVSRHHRSLYSNALRRLGDPNAAEDAVQDAFLRAFRNIERFDGDYHLDAWLHRIVTNTCHDIGRRRGRDTRLFDRACTEVELVVAPADEALDAVPREQVTEALDALPENYREVLVLRFVDELSYADVAEQAGISEENARARVSRGRTMLKRMLTTTSALLVWAIAPLRRQAQLTGAEAEAANQAAAQVHGLATIAATAPAPTHAFSQVSGIIAQAGPAIATAAPAVSSGAPALKAAVAVGLAASVAIPAGVAVDRARDQPTKPVPAQVEDESAVAAPGAPVTVEGSGSKGSGPGPTGSGATPVEALSAGQAEVVVGSVDQTTTTDSTTPTSAATDGSTDPTDPSDSTDSTTPDTEAPPTTSAPAPTAPPTTEQPATQQPPAPAPEPGRLSAQLQVTNLGGDRLGLDGPITITVGDRTSTGDLSGKLAIGPADPKDPQAPRQVELSTLYLTLDGASFELVVSGTAVTSEQGQGELHELSLRYRLVGGEALGLAESGTTSGILDVRHAEGSLTLSLPGADATSDS